MVSGKVFLGAVAAVAIFVGFGAGAAKADGWRGDGYGRGGYERGGDWGREEWRRHEWLEHHRYCYGYYPQPRVYYAPPAAGLLCAPALLSGRVHGTDSHPVIA
jgi:hypothetical protein